MRHRARPRSTNLAGHGSRPGRAERASPAPGVEPGDGQPGVEEPDASQPVALEARGLVKRYAGRSALSPGVGLEVRRGELVACIGTNGAGKTTLLSILAGVQQADDGTVDRPTGRVGWVPQQPALYGKLTAAENLARLRPPVAVDAVRLPRDPRQPLGAAARPL